MSLLLRYKFNGPTNADLLTDSSGNSKHLVASNVSIPRSFDEQDLGRVAEFYDPGGDLTLANPPAEMTGSNPRTFSYWIQQKEIGHPSYVHGNSGGQDYFVQWRNNKYIQIQGTYVNVENVGLSLASNTWYHFALTYSGSTQHCYLDGVLIHTQNRSLSTGAGAFKIGNAYSFNTPLNAYLSDFRVYGDALSAADISTLFTEGANPPPPVNWVLDANSKYEISSKEHLIQLMNDGAIRANEGSVPTNFWSSDYIQTVDIDLEGDSANIKPIGTDTNIFTGEYNGNGFTISNWSYIDPNLNSPDPENSVGLFGRINNATVKNVSLAGVCTLNGWKTYAGMVVGYATSSNFFNIDCNLSSGSYLTQNNTVSTSSKVTAGTVMGYILNCTTTAITLRGVCDALTFSASVYNHLTGGVVGRVDNGVHTLIRNLCTFPSGLAANQVGGVIGLLSGTVTKLLNAMVGDLNSDYDAGGVVGQCVVQPASGEYVNSMKGDINAGRYVGGVLGVFVQTAGSTMPSLMNYMGGNLTSAHNWKYAGGIIGDGRNTDMNLATSINAMNGEVDKTVLGKDYAVTDLAFIDTSYGLTFNTDAYSTTTPVTGLPTDPATGLPMVDLTATDPDGVVHTFDFVFGNGPRLFNQLKIEHSGQDLYITDVEVLVISGTDIVPLGVSSSANPSISTQVGGVATWTLDFDKEYALSEINKVVFSKGGANPSGAVVSLYSLDGGDPEQIGVLNADDVQEFIITDTPLRVVPRPVSVQVTVSRVNGATAYRLTSQKTGSPKENTAKSNFTDLEQTIKNLEPGTEYTFRLYSTSGAGYSLVDESVLSTLENSASNYDKNEFVGTSGRFDLSSLDSASVGFMSDIMNDIFVTGDTIDISVPGGRGTKTSKFVNRGGNVAVEDSEALVAPFSKDGGAGQSVTLTLSDASVVAVSYDETTEAITVGSTSYASGDSFVLDGKKATIVDI